MAIYILRLNILQTKHMAAKQTPFDDSVKRGLPSKRTRKVK